MTGTHITDKEALHQDIRYNAPLLAALIGVWERNINYNTKAIIPYNSALSRFVALKQTDCESNGKQSHEMERHYTIRQAIIFGEPGQM